MRISAHAYSLTRFCMVTAIACLSTLHAAVIHVHSAADLAKQKQSPGIVLIKYGAQWCPPCRNIAPVLESLSNELTNVRFISVDVDEVRGAYQGSIPFLELYKDGSRVSTRTGFQSASQLRSWIGSFK